MRAVSNSTPLIHLSRISKISYLKSLFEKIFIPVEIFGEVVIKGKEFEKKEVTLIEKLVEENFIVVKDVASKVKMPNLHPGELKAISLCKQLNIKNLLIDDKEGFDAAKILNLKPLRTTALLLKLLNKKIIKFDIYKESLLSLSESGYFLGAETYEKLLEAGRKLR